MVPWTFTLQDRQNYRVLLEINGEQHRMMKFGLFWRLTLQLPFGSYQYNYIFDRARGVNYLEPVEGNHNIIHVNELTYMGNIANPLIRELFENSNLGFQNQRTQPNPQRQENPQQQQQNPQQQNPQQRQQQYPQQVPQQRPQQQNPQQQNPQQRFQQQNNGYRK